MESNDVKVDEVQWLLSLTTDELITLNGIMYGLQLVVEKKQDQGYGSKMILNIAQKVSSLKTFAMGKLEEFENGYSKPE